MSIYDLVVLKSFIGEKMAHKTFQEYLDARNKLQNTGKEQQIADYIGPKASAPGKEKKHKHAGGHGQQGKPKPYAGTTTAKDPNKGKNTDGFASKGDKKLEYQPHKGNKSTKKAGVPGGKEVASWPRTKTQEWLNSTKEMSLKEFTKHLNECDCKGASSDSIREAVILAKNDSAMVGLVREMKRQNNFNKFIIEAFKHEEAFAVLARLMENEQYAKKLVRAMNEIVAPPMSDDMDDEENPDEMGHDDDMEGEENPDDMGGDEEMGHDDDMGDEENPDDMGGDEEMGHDDDMDSHDPMSGLGHMPMSKKKKPKHKFHGHNHLMNALKGNPPMGHEDMGGMGM